MSEYRDVFLCAGEMMLESKDGIVFDLTNGESKTLEVQEKDLEQALMIIFDLAGAKKHNCQYKIGGEYKVSTECADYLLDDTPHLAKKKLHAGETVILIGSDGNGSIEFQSYLVRAKNGDELWCWSRELEQVENDTSTTS